MQITVNFDEIYSPTFISNDFTEMHFESLLKDGKSQKPMNSNIQNKINELKKMATSSVTSAVDQQSIPRHDDSLSKLIRSKKDADHFLAEVESAFKMVK